MHLQVTYWGAWIQEEFWRNVLSVVVVSVVVISLTIGTLGGYALARSNFRCFLVADRSTHLRAMPHITLVSGYCLHFLNGIYGASSQLPL